MSAVEVITYLESIINPNWIDNTKLQKIKNNIKMAEELVKNTEILNDYKRKELDKKYGFLYTKLRPQICNEILKECFIESLQQYIVNVAE